MKKSIVALAVGILCSAAYAENFTGPTQLTSKTFDNEVTISGPATLKQVKAKSLKVNGPVEFTDLEVEQNIDIKGPIKNGQNGKFGTATITGTVQASNIEVEKLNVTGSANFTQLEVKDAEIIGPLTAKQSHFQNLTATANEITLDNVQAANIIIKKDKGNVEQKVFLKGNTVVQNINFESGKGKVVQNDTAQVAGEIKGGQLEKKQP